MEPFSYQSFETTLTAEVNAGRVPMARIDDAVSRILTEKFRLGLFEHPFADRTLLGIGLFSMLVAALFLLGTRNFKRMLAYSSVEHMGILCIGAALGKPGVAAALFHVWGNGLTKGALFLSAGNIRRSAGARPLSWPPPSSSPKRSATS